jgi:hypothetical protein
MIAQPARQSYLVVSLSMKKDLGTICSALA